MHEAKILKSLSGEKGFVSFHHFGYENKHNLLVMGLLGPSLEDLFNACNRTFSLKTILILA
jgi:serine/threonine protein kinase